MQKVDIILLLILQLDKSKITTIIDILYSLGNCFSLADVAKNKIVTIKRDFVIVKNITCAKYKKHDKKIYYISFLG